FRMMKMAESFAYLDTVMRGIDGSFPFTGFCKEQCLNACKTSGGVGRLVFQACINDVECFLVAAKLYQQLGPYAVDEHRADLSRDGFQNCERFGELALPRQIVA